MLREIRYTVHKDYGFIKKWYHSDSLDLFLWFRKGKLIKFQLCNKTKTIEEAIVWCRLSGLDFYIVDRNNQLQRNMVIKLYQCSCPIDSSIVAKFDKESNNLPVEIKFVIKSIIHLAIFN